MQKMDIRKCAAAEVKFISSNASFICSRLIESFGEMSR